MIKNSTKYGEDELSGREFISVKWAGNLNMERLTMVILLSGNNQRFWSHSGCSKANTFIGLISAGFLSLVY